MGKKQVFLCKKEGKASLVLATKFPANFVANTPRSQAKSLHESSLQAVPILSALLACPLPLLLGAQPLKPANEKEDQMPITTLGELENYYLISFLALCNHEIHIDRKYIHSPYTKTTAA